MTTTERVSWVQGGHDIAVDVASEGFTAFIDGKRQQGSRITPPLRAQKSLYDARDAAGNIGSLIIYCPRAKELEAIRAKLLAQKPIDPMEEFDTLECRVQDAEEMVRAHHENPAYAYHQLSQAKSALSAWVEANRELYEAEIGLRRAAEQARRASIRIDYGM